MSTSAIGTILDDIVAALGARPGLADVTVNSGDVLITEAGVESILLAEAQLDEEACAMTGGRLEVWTIGGAVRVASGAWEGSTEESIKAVRDRALELLAEVETSLNDTYTGELPDVELLSADMQQYPDPDGRVCSITFTLRMQATKNP